MPQQLSMLNISSSVASFASASSMGWMITIIIFILTIGILILVFRNIKRIIYGSIVSGIAIGVYRFSRWIGVSTQNKNYVPITWFVYIIIFLICSWLIGLWLEKSKIIKKIENKFDEPLIKEIRKNKQ